jgi:hypothetical protein
MFSNRAAFAALALACLAATAGGGYLATRQSAEPMALPAATASQQLSPAAQPVQETEATVGDPAPSAQPAPAPPAPVAQVATTRTATPTSTRSAAPARPTTRERSTPTPTAPARDRQPPALERTWPSSAAPGASSAPQTSSSQPADTPAPVATVEERAAIEPVRAPEPPQKTFEELVVSAESVLGLQIESALSSERARVEDRVEAHVVRDVRVSNEVAIPAGAKALGSVMLVERGGKFKERARLGIRFHTLVLADGTRLPITTETIYRYGDAPGNSSTAKVGGGAVAGAILGAILGGAKGAAIGATTGAGAGTAAVVAGDRSAAEFPAGTEVTARMLSPVTVTIEK